MANSDKPQSAPRRFIVSLQLGGAFFAVANVICVAIFAYAYLASRLEPRTLEVKGSAKKTITSDTIVWEGVVTAHDADLIQAYNKIKTSADHVTDFIHAAGIPDKQVTAGSITTNKIYQREVVPPAPGNDDDKDKHAPVIVQTSKIEMYVLTQQIRIESHDMEKVPAISRNVTSLIKDGVEIESGSPSYLYSKLSDLKIDMLAEATRDATNRATQIVTNANGRLGKLVDAKMGVMQINPKGVSDVSSTGNNDETSLEKDILAVVTVRFELR
jgi:hypothetical protein